MCDDVLGMVWVKFGYHMCPEGLSVCQWALSLAFVDLLEMLSFRKVHVESSASLVAFSV